MHLRYCYDCRKRTPSIEDFNSRACKRCGKIVPLGRVSFSAGSFRIPKTPRFSDKIRVKRM